MYTKTLTNRRLFNLFVILVMFLSSSTSLGSALASTATGNPQDCTWMENSPTIWQEIMCRPPSDVGNSAGNNPSAPNSPAPAIATSSVPWSVQLEPIGTEVHDIATDFNGNVYVTGAISTADDSDAFVRKLDSNGNTVWSYSFSGMMDDEGSGIALDADGHIYVTGSMRNIFGTSDIILARLTNDGVLLWLTFEGNAAQQDYGEDIALDESGNIYIAGGSFGSWGSPIRPYTSGQYDAFVAKFDPTLGIRVWNTFLGEGLNGFGTGIAADSAGSVYVTGVNFVPGSSSNAFVAGLDANGSQLWYTTLGSAGVNDSGRDIASDATGNIYVAGESWASWGSPLSAFSGAEDAFVVKLSNDGSLQWNTFVGGTGWDMGYGIDVDASGSIYISGNSTIVWGNPFDSGTGTPQEVFAAKLDNNGTLQWNTFIIGEAWYQSYGHLNRIAEQNGSVYIPSNVGVFESAVAYVTKINGPLCLGSVSSPSSSIAQAVAAEVGEQEYCGNQYDGLITLPPGRDAFERFQDLAATANYEVDFVTMGWDPAEDNDPNTTSNDSPGEIFLRGLKTLYEAVKANPENYPGGVRVRILLGLKYYQFTGCQDQRVIVMNDLHRLGLDVPIPNWTVEVAAYRGANQDGCDVDQLFNGVHSHVKMMIVDGKHVITGGYNLHYNYLGANPVHDMGVKVNGPIASHTLLIFDHLWLGAHLCENNSCTQESIVATIDHDPEVVSPISTGNDVVFSLFRDDNHKTADNAIVAAIEAANSEVNLIQAHFINPSYYMPPQYATAILNSLSNDEVQVNLLLSGDIAEIALSANGVCNLYYQLLMLHPLNLFNLDVKFSAFSNPIHTKALSIDDTFIIVGSQNFDGSAWGDDNFDLDLAEYSLGIDSAYAAGNFNTEFWHEWGDAYPFFCINNPFSPMFSLQNAVDQSAPGSILFLPAGVYTESVTINKPLTLIGTNPNQTIIQPEGNQPAFRITSSDVTIMNMRISGGAGYGIELIDSSPSSLNNIQINQVVFENNALGGVLVQGLIPGSPVNYAIENNTFIGGADGVAINMLETQADVSFIRNNIFSGQSVAPIHILSADDSRVEYSYNLFDECGAGICASNWHLGNISAASSEHDNLFDLNPLFASPANGAYQLSAVSPAIDAGDPSLWHDLYYDGDNDGAIRIDIGAFEYVPVANLPPVVNAGNDQTVEVGDNVTVNATYFDSDNSEGHSVRIDWGDGVVENVPTIMTGPGAGEVAGRHTYAAEVDAYTVEVCVVDLYGGVGCDTISVEIYSLPTSTPTLTLTPTLTFTPSPTFTPTSSPTPTATLTPTVTSVYHFTGFFPPVGNRPTLNLVKAGSAVPVKFSLNGYQGLNIFADGYPTSGAVTCGSTVEDAIEQTVTAGASSLSYDTITDQYVYIWKTIAAWANTCRTLVVKLNDGTYHRADFKFKK